MAPNPWTCEVEFKDADGVARKLALSMDATARLEAKYDEHIGDVLSRFSDNPRVSFVIEVFCLLLVGDHSEEEAARICGRLGMYRGLKLVKDALQLGMAEEFGEEEALQNGSRPPKAGRKIGPPTLPPVSATV